MIALILVLFCCAVSADLPYRSVTAANGAVCLDGTPAGYYYRITPGVTRWIVYINGGGWCYDYSDCAARANTLLGSSKFWPKTQRSWGFMSDNNATNPYFASWNAIIMIYCDGGSFTGNADSPYQVGNQTLWFRGARILRETFDDLLNKYGMDSATDVMLTGCSAGGLSTFLHADRVQSWLSPNTKFGAVPDSGFFLNASIYSDPTRFVYGEQMRNVFNMQNSTGGVSQRCVRANRQDPARCIFAPQAYTQIDAPLFTLNSLYDSWQVPIDRSSFKFNNARLCSNNNNKRTKMGNVIGLDSPTFVKCANGGPFNCSATNIAGANNFRDQMLSSVLKVMTRPQDGFYLDSCWGHCGAEWAEYNTMKISGVTPREAVEKWWRNSFQRPPRLVDCEYTTNQNCNPICNSFKVNSWLEHVQF